jgi:hypothetical protein
MTQAGEQGSRGRYLPPHLLCRLSMQIKSVTTYLPKPLPRVEGIQMQFSS